MFAHDNASQQMVEFKQINPPSSYHIYTKLTLQDTHHHSAPLSHSRTYYTTSLQLPTDTHHAVGPGFVEGSLQRGSPAR